MQAMDILILMLLGLIVFEFYSGAPMGKIGKDNPATWSVMAGFHVCIFLAMVSHRFNQLPIFASLQASLSTPNDTLQAEIVLPAVAVCGVASFAIRKLICSLKNEEFCKG